ncbi:MAG: 4Fe-4S binding protein [Nitrososphaerota archaeon]|nr:4Fe-4S binding protein [Candidatus Bathyarchaeota archaeon]MDW8022738.1 4Fe-4S binding protein [Nitrososphaerota archaeon]
MVDLTVKLESLMFKNPILVGPTIVNEYPEMLEKCLAHGAGGVITPTYTGRKEDVFRPRPYIIGPQRLFPDLDMFFTLAEYSAVPFEEALKKHVPSLRKLCAGAGVPLIVSVLASSNLDFTVKLVKDFASQADALELSMFHLKDEDAAKVIDSVKNVGVPVIARINSWSYDGQFLKKLMQAGVKAISVYTQMPKGMLVDPEIEEPYGINWASNTMFGKSMLPLSLAVSASVACAYPKANLIAIDHATEAEDVIQYLLMGCKGVSICYGIQRFGYKQIGNIIEGIQSWMETKGYQDIESFRGKAAKRIKDPFLSDKAFQPTTESGAEYMPTIDTSLCKPRECIRCEEFCLHEVFKVVPEEARVEIKDENCYGCGICVALCPEGAITLLHRCTEEVVFDGRGACRNFVDRS